jgi:phospholipid/cholesterol/gamma-HCH transport system substrate-binding protein
MELPARGFRPFGPARGYRITAEFDNIGGLGVGDPVTMAGVPVGQVERITLDRRDYRALVTMRILLQYNRIPADSEATVDTMGIFGGKYIAIDPGGARSYLMNGSRLESTQSAFVLENVVNKLFAELASKTGGNGKKEASR